MEELLIEVAFIIKVTAGGLFALAIHDYILAKTRPKQTEKQVIRRVVPVNYGKFADPIGEYEQFKDEKTNLYTSYVPKKNEEGKRR